MTQEKKEVKKQGGVVISPKPIHTKEVIDKNGKVIKVTVQQ
jgi:hypothetical protein